MVLYTFVYRGQVCKYVSVKIGQNVETPSVWARGRLSRWDKNKKRLIRDR